MTNRRLIVPVVALLAFISIPLVADASPLKRDHLTPQEVDLVKEAQVLDQRIAVFIHAAERRLMVLNGVPSGTDKKLQKESEKWGELPKGTRAELLGDVAGILDEAITNIDDVASREDADQKILRKSVRTLSNAVTGFVAQLESMKDKTSDPTEKDILEQIFKTAGDIVEASQKLPAEPDPKKKSKTS
jgi:hypothetical protein